MAGLYFHQHSPLGESKGKWMLNLEGFSVWEHNQIQANVLILITPHCFWIHKSVRTCFGTNLFHGWPTASFNYKQIRTLTCCCNKWKQLVLANCYSIRGSKQAGMCCSSKIINFFSYNNMLHLPSFLNYKADRDRVNNSNQPFQKISAFQQQICGGHLDEQGFSMLCVTTKMILTQTYV